MMIIGEAMKRGLNWGEESQGFDARRAEENGYDGELAKPFGFAREWKPG